MFGDGEPLEKRIEDNPDCELCSQLDVVVADSTAVNNVGWVSVPYIGKQRADAATQYM